MASIGRMDKAEHTVRVAVIRECVRNQLGGLSPYPEALEQLIADASQAATWKEWALEVMCEYSSCKREQFEEPFDPDVAREAIGESLKALADAHERDMERDDIDDTET